jgi:acyl-CoA thioesterase I
MRKFLIVAVAIVVLAGVGYVLYLHHSAAPVSQVRNYPSQGTDIIAFGDSLVAGVGATPGHDLVSDLSNDIGEPIVNLGHAGDTTADGLARIDEIDQYHPKVVILLLGGNDYLDHDNMTQAFANLGQMVQYIEARGAIVLLVGMRISPLVGNFDPQFGQLQQEYQTAYVPDVLDGFYGKSEFMSDSIHPNDAGYSIMASRIAPTLEQLIQ